MKKVDEAKTETVNLAKRLKRAKEKLLKFEELTEKQEMHVSLTDPLHCDMIL